MKMKIYNRAGQENANIAFQFAIKVPKIKIWVKKNDLYFSSRICACKVCRNVKIFTRLQKKF